MGSDRPRWYQIGQRRQLNGGDRQVAVDRTADDPQALDDLQAPGLTPPDRRWSPADRDGAMVARSQILVSGSTATLLGTMTNETGCDVHFSGMPPYARMLDTDGTRPVLLGDFNSPPREQPSSGDWVMHPGASVPYRSLPMTLQDPDPRWDGTDWCASSQSTALDKMTFHRARALPTIQIIS